MHCCQAECILSWISSNRFGVLLQMVLLMQVCHHKFAAAGGSVKFLPGFQGPLPFELETGYVGVGESDGVQLYYYFVKSEGNPKEDPLMLWINGGPGCTSLTGLMYEIGPITFKFEKYNGSLPNLILRSHAWTKLCSIIFLDSPVGTGFSYSDTEPLSKLISDTKQVLHAYQFLRKWLKDVHPEYLPNPLYIAGDSYSGITVPILTQEVSNGNERGILPRMNLQGYSLGNPVVDLSKDYNYRVPYAHGMALISDELYESWKTNCHGEDWDTNQSSAACIRDKQTFTELTSHIARNHILEPKCELTSPRPRDRTLIAVPPRRSTKQKLETLVDSRLSLRAEHCPASAEYLSAYWANDEDVQKALHVRKGSIGIGEWKRCSKTLPYEHDVSSSLPYHANLSRKGYRSLVYSGDHDLLIPFLGTQAWIRSLNYSIIDDWRPWQLDGQVAGYTRSYSNKMTFATVKGAGHTAPQYKPDLCFAMISRWLLGEPL